jgi:hypothetical protein
MTFGELSLADGWARLVRDLVKHPKDGLQVFGTTTSRFIVFVVESDV